MSENNENERKIACKIAQQIIFMNENFKIDVFANI